MLNQMCKETDSDSEDSEASATDGIEDFLMDSVADDDRLGNGTVARDADNVLDFIQMTGLASSSRVSYPEEAAPDGDDLVSFFEEGVGDVDGTMDPMAPMLPEMDVPATDGLDAFGSDLSISELDEIVSELNQLESASEDSRTATHTEELPAGDERPHETETSRAFAALAEFQESPVGVEEDVFPDAPESETELVDRAIAAAIEAESTATIGDLQEAKSLLDELDTGHALSDEPLESGREPDPLPATAPALALDNTGVTPPKDIQSQSYLRQRHRRRKRVGRWGLRIALALVFIGVGYAGVQLYLNQAESPADAYRRAEKLLEEGMYEPASKEFQSFARRFPTELNSSDAMFMAGYSMQLAPAIPRDEAQASYAQSLELLERFIVENPSHAKAARAETLMGLLYFRMDMPMESIRILGGSDRRLRDPSAYLTSLRTLGRAYASVSQIENARSAFMRAASLEENIAPDMDYVELGAMYHRLSERSATAGLEREYGLRAIEQWDYALRVPGLLKSRREEIRLMRDIVAGSVDEAGGVDASARAGIGAEGSG